MYAVENNSYSCIPFLATEIGKQDKSHATALHYACTYNYFECAKYLLHELHIQNSENKTPLQIAKEKGANDCFRIMENYIITRKWFEAAEKENDSFIKQEINRYKRS